MAIMSTGTGLTYNPVNESKDDEKCYQNVCMLIQKVIKPEFC